MEFKGIRKTHEGKFITRYDVDYITAEGNPKTYEMISRNRNIQTLDDLQNRKPNAVVMVMTDESGERILVNREYRMAMAQWIYNFPAGLIDPGESPEKEQDVSCGRKPDCESCGLTISWTTATAPSVFPMNGTSASLAWLRGNSARAPRMRRRSPLAGTRRKKSKNCYGRNHLQPEPKPIAMRGQTVKGPANDLRRALND